MRRSVDGAAARPGGRVTPAALLVVVLATAAALRCWRLYWGLADDLWFHDEQTSWQPRIAPFRSLAISSFDVRSLGYPTLYGYIGGLTAWLTSQFGVPVFDRFPDTAACLRTISAIASVLTVLAVARVGAAMYGPWTGIAAAAFLAVAPLDAMQTHYASVEPLLGLFVTLALGASWWLFRHGTVGSALAGGTVVGLAGATKYPGLAFATAVGWAVLERAWQERSVRRALLLGVAAGLGLVVGFSMTCPPCVLRPDVLLKSVGMHELIAGSGAMPNNCIAPSLGWWGRRWLQQLVAILPYGLGLPLVVLAYAGVLVAVVRRMPADRILLAAIVPFFVYVGRFNDVFPRYYLPLFPALVILGAAALRSLPPRAAIAIAVVVFGYGLALSASQVSRFSWDQQQTVARWLGDRAHLLAPQDRRVNTAGNLGNDPFFRVRAPIAARGYTAVVRQPRQWLTDRPAFFVLPEWAAIAMRRDRRSPLVGVLLNHLESPRSGYVPILHVPIPQYLNRSLYERLDPAFAVDVWQGAVGFRVYAREDVAALLRANDAAR